MTRLIVGLGNPDEQYKETRHNVGFIFLDYFARRSSQSESESAKKTDAWELDKNTNSLVLKTKLEKTAFILAKPQTYVNKSGEAVKKLLKNLKSEIKNLIVIHDDLDILFGNVKMSFDKNSGGHKGIESIMRVLKTKKFYRLRIGLAKPALQKARQQSDKKRDEFVRNYVLSKFTHSEQETLKNVFKEGYEKLNRLLVGS